MKISSRSSHAYMKDLSSPYSRISKLFSNFVSMKLKPKQHLEYMKHIFNQEQQNKAAFICSNPIARLSELYRSEVENLAIIWCYYSGKIEGNSYTYVETETLLKDQITSLKRYEDAEILINLHNTFTTELEYIKEINSKEKLDEILYQQEQYTNPLERAVYLHCNIAQLQPFANKNKHASRMIESIVLMNADIIPVYSLRETDILNYKKGLISFLRNWRIFPIC